MMNTKHCQAGSADTTPLFFFFFEVNCGYISTDTPVLNEAGCLNASQRLKTILTHLVWNTVHLKLLECVCDNKAFVQ